jgi:predicted ATPase
MIEPDEPHLLQEITPRGLLSFGPDTGPIGLQSLNILIGANGSGKSNLMEAIALLRATRDDIRSVISRGGGVGDWIWKGSPDGIASLGVVVQNPHRRQSLRHTLSFRQVNQTFHLEDERIENDRPLPGHADPYFYYRYQNGRPVLNVGGGERQLIREIGLKADRSILAQLRDPDAYPEITYLADIYEPIRIYREWGFGRNTVFREPQRADMRDDRLEEDFSNLGLVLSRLFNTPKTKHAILEALRDLYEGLTDCNVLVKAGTVQVFLTEGEFTIPATRLSDGTLRYLCLLAILCDPEAPPLICIEEPELGLHPDIMPKIADLLVAASKHTQIIVTTHSDILVDAMTERPEAVLVCEKHKGVTQIQRLDSAELKIWLDKYRLGELWTSGEIGGTRW